MGQENSNLEMELVMELTAHFEVVESDDDCLKVHDDGLFFKASLSDLAEMAEEIGVRATVNRVVEDAEKMGGTWKKVLSSSGEELLEKVQFRVVSRGTFVGNVPHFEFLDFVVTFAVEGSGTKLVVDSEISEKFNFTLAQLKETATKNFWRDGYSVKTMREVLDSLLGGLGSTGLDGELEDGEMRIVTSQSGASVLLFPEIFEKLAEEMGDLFVLPSSVFEVIVIPVEGKSLEDLKQLVRDTNSEVVDKKDQLSNGVYYWKKGLGALQTV